MSRNSSKNQEGKKASSKNKKRISTFKSLRSIISSTSALVQFKEYKIHKIKVVAHVIENVSDKRTFSVKDSLITENDVNLVKIK